MSAEITQKLATQESRIQFLENSVSSMVEALKENTASNRELITKFAVYSEKHDSVEVDVARIRDKIDKHSEDLAAINPFINSLRGVVWKIVTASVLGGTGVAALLTVVSKISQGG